MRIVYTLTIFILSIQFSSAQILDFQVNISVLDLESKKSVSDINIEIIGDNFNALAITDTTGNSGIIKLKKGKYVIRGFVFNYTYFEKEVSIDKRDSLIFWINKDFIMMLDEVVISEKAPILQGSYCPSACGVVMYNDPFFVTLGGVQMSDGAPATLINFIGSRD